MRSDADYYAVLGVLPSIEQAALAAVYRALLKKYHPDVFDGPKAEAERITKELNEAYEVLGDPETRAQYDSSRAAAQERSGDYSRTSDADASDRVPEVPHEDWAFVLRYFPEAETQRMNLARFSRSLGFAFQVVLLETKNFANLNKTADALLSEYLTRYFGSHPAVQSFAKDALLEGRRDVALELNHAIKTLGTPEDPDRLLTQIRKHFGWEDLRAKAEQEERDRFMDRVLIIFFAVFAVFFILISIYVGGFLR